MIIIHTPNFDGFTNMTTLQVPALMAIPSPSNFTGDWLRGAFDSCEIGRHAGTDHLQRRNWFDPCPEVLS